jgi:hypothetical protein
LPAACVYFFAANTLNHQTLDAFIPKVTGNGNFGHRADRRHQDEEQDELLGVNQVTLAG